MKNEQDREQLQRYFGQGNNSDPLKNSNRPKRSEDLSFDQTQWFVSEDGQDEDDFEREEPQPQEDFLPNGGKKKKRRQSRLSRFAQSFVLICVFVGAAIFLAYFALTSASDLLGLGQPDQQIEVTLTEEEASSLSKTAQVLKDKGVEILAKPEDEPVWQEKAMGVWPQFYDKVGGKAVVDEALAIMQQ